MNRFLLLIEERLIRTLILILGPFILFSNLLCLPTSASTWKEVISSSSGQQWWDTESIVYQSPDKLTISTRFLPLSKGDVKQPRENFYTMQIDCSQKLYKDTSINGIQVLDPQWLSPEEDALINSVINEACSKDLIL